MNEHGEPEITPGPIVSAPTIPPSKPFSYWARRLLVCNPFYLVSAALLLFGMYRISVDRNLFAGEISQLVFNLASLEFYEILLVATAIFLAARRIWYDSTLLVGLENLFVFVPFILVSQVALISTRVVWVVCAVTAFVAIARFGSLKKYFAELNLPKGLLLIGSALLVINIGLLVTYRVVGERKMGWVPDSGRDFVINQFTWLAILPAAAALANFLPHARETGSFEPQRRWLPAGFFVLWIIATGAHLYCLNYVYNFAFRIGMFVPAVWVLCWTMYRRGPEFLAWQSRAPQQLLTIAALLLPLAAASASGTNIFFALTLMNAVIFGVMSFRGEDRHLATQLFFASLMLLICGFPMDWVGIRLAHFAPLLHRETYIIAGIGSYLMLYAVMSRDPKVGIFGSVLVMTLAAIAFPNHAATIHWAVQGGLVFLLLHSLRWMDSEHQGAGAVRILAAIVWMVHTVIWVRSDAAFWMPCISGGIVLVVYLIAQLLRGRWDLPILPAASILTVLSGPGNFLIGYLHSASLGLLAVIGSFLLFALGTAAALTKHRWHRTSA